MLKEMLRFHFTGVTTRKCCLYEIACVRRVIHHFPGDICRRAVELATRAIEQPELRKSEECLELLSKGRHVSQELFAESVTAHSAQWRLRVAECDCAVSVLMSDPMPEELGIRPAHVLHVVELDAGSDLDSDADLDAEDLAQIALVREIFGNPFQPVKFRPEWCTDTATALARQMYESCDFGAMPILADALQDAGCERAEVLNHCRDANQVHVRGCWVVDHVLGKT
jgi:hypothetical protein